MRSHIKKIILLYLTALAKQRLKVAGGKVIGIAGSVGKTSSKDAIAHVLGSEFKIIKNEKSYNSEIGLPLAVLQQKSGFSSPIAWPAVIINQILNKGAMVA